MPKFMPEIKEYLLGSGATMKRLSLAALFIFVTIAVCQAAPLKLSRGVGVHEWLNWSPLVGGAAYRWPPYRSQREWLSGARPYSDWPAGNQFVRIRSMGFDFVRLSVDPGPLLDSRGARRKEALNVLAKYVRQVTDAKLKVVFNLHSVEQVPAYGMALINGGADSEGIKLYRKMVSDVAEMLVKIGTDKVALEPYNEPAYYPCDSSGTEDWQKIMAATVRDIRAVSSKLTIVATGACGGDVIGLEDMKTGFDDDNIYYSFHMYDPHSFSHQRTDDPGGFLSGLPWPANTGNPEAVKNSLRAFMQSAGLTQQQQDAQLAAVDNIISDYFSADFGVRDVKERIGKAVDWAKAHRIPPKRIFMGEFGVILISADGRMGANNPDRLRYLSAVRKEAEAFGISWSIWEYSNPYGMSVILPQGRALPDQKLLKVLGL